MTGIRGLAALRCLGPTSAVLLAEAGAPDARTLRKLGPMACFRRLRFHFGKRVTVNFVYAMECAVREMHWRDIEPARTLKLKEGARVIAAELDARAGAESAAALQGDFD